jgi:dTDP-D-glucose 4,6-dehydratase
LDEPLRIHGDGTAARDYIFVEDVCKAIDVIMHANIDKVKVRFLTSPLEFIGLFYP